MRKASLSGRTPGSHRRPRQIRGAPPNSARNHPWDRIYSRRRKNFPNQGSLESISGSRIRSMPKNSNSIPSRIRRASNASQEKKEIWTRRSLKVSRIKRKKRPLGTQGRSVVVEICLLSRILQAEKAADPHQLRVPLRTEDRACSRSTFRMRSRIDRRGKKCSARWG